MFTNDRQNMRQFFCQVWQKYLENNALEPLEQQVLAVILEHPEYLIYLEESELQIDFDPEENPFLHLGLHLSLRDQVNTDRPSGIQFLYARLTEQLGDSHQAEHQCMLVLLECLQQGIMDEQVYLEKLREL
jgi:hypothetical protein